MFVLAHLSDPHLGPLPRPALSDLAGKRVLGWLNWHRERYARHVAPALDAIVKDIAGQAPDHIAVTGDLVNIALDAEFPSARRFLLRLGPPEHVTLVPGNHDAYVRAGVTRHGPHWGDFMRGDGAGAGAPDDVILPFPFVRRRGPVALVGLSTAVPTAPFMATGRLGAAQLIRLADALDALGREGLFRVVLIHHPPVPFPRSRFKRLVDADAFARVIGVHGAELILHGHEHVHALAAIAGPHGPVPVVGVPSASAAPLPGHDDPAGYNLYRIDGAPGRWRCQAISRGMTSFALSITQTGSRMLLGGEPSRAS